VIYGSSQKWPLPRLAGNLQVSPKIKVYFWDKIKYKKYIWSWVLLLPKLP